MASKRSRAAFEADLQAQQSPYVIYGTPLPPLDPDSRDDGSYVPVWQQEVTDEKGRKRLHGAFTGGYSAGYFNTVGSKEGWTPSTFVSSRSNRKKDEPVSQQRPEDFMDEEDLAEAEEARKLQTLDTFAGFGLVNGNTEKNDSLIDMLRVGGETMGVRLLKKMGWREGQGIGPKVRRKAKNEEEEAEDDEKTHLFAPENSNMIQFIRKTDKKGLGFEGEQGLERSQPTQDVSEAETGNGNTTMTTVSQSMSKDGKVPKMKEVGARGGFGIGILNDDGSDDEDPYSIGPQLSYNRVVGGAKKKKKKAAAIKPGANPSLNNKPVFISKKTALAKGNPGFRRCHDGRLPIDGFVLSTLSDALASIISQDEKYPAPEVPVGWKPSRAGYGSTASTTKPSEPAPKLNPTSRAALLGEAPLPGKSIFDYLSPESRDRLASATGNKSLPPGLGERFATSPRSEKVSQTPSIPKAVALSALGRGTGGWLPYNDNPAKRARYELYLQHQGGIRGDAASLDRPADVGSEDWTKELQEFAHAATIFKPMTGAMASRFTSSSSVTMPTGIPNEDQDGLLRLPSQKQRTPAEEAAAAGMYGALTRTVEQWVPTRLLCKRFNVQPPTHVPPDPREGDNGEAKPTHSTALPGKQLEILGKRKMDELRQGGRFASGGLEGGNVGMAEHSVGGGMKERRVVIDVERNEAIEGQRPEEKLFKDIFGSDSEDD